MSIVRVGLSNKKFAEGFDAIFAKKKTAKKRGAKAKAKKAGKKK